MALTAQRKRPTHHKKALGAHHQHSKHYLKTYSPYLPLLILVVVGLAINVVWTSRTQVLGASTNISATELLQDTNVQRLKHGQDDLKLSDKLSSAAQSKANDMATKKYWSHTSPTGDKPWKSMTKSGYSYYAAGENLAYGFASSESAITGWMNSREHRANLLSADFREVGFGIVSTEDFQGQAKTTIIVAMYAEPALNLGGYGFASSATSLPSEIPVRNVARVQLLTGSQAPWSVALIMLVSLLAAAWFLTRHFKIWKRVLVESEEFIVEHKFLDVLIIATAITGFILTRTAGFIH